jgi:clan AA aspartic protease (TIGR02281 family)
VAALMSGYIVRRRRIVVVRPVKEKHGGGGWLPALGLIAAVAFFASRSGGDTPPHSGQDRTLVIPADAGNACHAELSIHGHRFRVLLDSGATGGAPLVFGFNQAAALGFDPRALNYSGRYGSANGEGREAFVRLADVRLQDWRLGNVPAVITRAAQDEGLFGAELLHRLEFRTTKGACVLTIPDDA